MKLYEGMFLVDNARANNDWDAVAAHVHGILDRHGAVIKRSQKWGERKLAYEIAGHKRCTYMLVHFEVGGDAIGPIRRDAGLSDTIARTLIVVDQDGEELPDILGDVAPPPGRDGDSRRPRGPRPETTPRAEKKDATPAKSDRPQHEEGTKPEAQKPVDAEAKPAAAEKAEATGPEETQADAPEPPPEQAQDDAQS